MKSQESTHVVQAALPKKRSRDPVIIKEKEKARNRLGSLSPSIDLALRDSQGTPYTNLVDACEGEKSVIRFIVCMSVHWLCLS